MLIGMQVHSQSSFDTTAFLSYLKANEDLSYTELNSLYSPGTYYKDRMIPARTLNYQYFDSIANVYGITDDELALLEKNKFMVSERLSSGNMISALDDIFKKDLPCFISTDCILDAIHKSYDRILISLELSILKPKLEEILELMAGGMNGMTTKYQEHAGLSDALGDVDLYISMARSLLTHTTYTPEIASREQFDTLLNSIYQEGFVQLPLFSERNRRLDFSQFKPRGHYINTWDTPQLEEYFRAMMWMGRMDFYLTPPPSALEVPWTKEEIRRMHLGSYLMQELLESTGAIDILKENDELIEFMVGKSDNLTPWEYGDIIKSFPGLNSADKLLTDEIYDPYYQAVSTSLLGEQKILSSLFRMDGSGPEYVPAVLPVSYKLFGQRFVIDSYIFSNVVYDRVVYQGSAVKRMMPDPLDVMFVLGNNNAGELLKEEIEEYHYSNALDRLRYLVEAYDQDFWSNTLYNTWLPSLRELNSIDKKQESHYFMNTVAWQQQKINTQLASWAQLRHDNLLYAKQSYTGIPICSFPHSFVEPYPGFYRRIAQFCNISFEFFSNMTVKNGSIIAYFRGVGTIMEQLATIAEKELLLEALNEEEKNFLRSMLSEGFGCGPELNGWFVDLHFESWGGSLSLPERETDYVIADVHTQPADAGGSIIGKILHVGTGKVNLGIYLIDHPSDNSVPTAYVGPFMSYYEHNTLNFERRTDQWWYKNIGLEYPARPDWTNVYLVNKQGKINADGRELKGLVFDSEGTNNQLYKRNFDVYPNPVSDFGNIRFALTDDAAISIDLFDAAGRKIGVIQSEPLSAGDHIIPWSTQNLDPGFYYLILNLGNIREVFKVIKQ
jgi:hypothetical protein